MRNCSYEKRLIGKFVLQCEDEMLNRTDTSVDDNKEACEKYNVFIHTILLIIICFWLLVVVSITQQIGLEKNPYYWII